MSTIHGASHRGLAHFRNNPAALAVYWIYCARVNRDNVAWPSLRGLATNTGWSLNTCAKARKWLVEHGALERVNDYTKPDWRNLDQAELAQRKNLDRTEYYRPTGTITIDNTTYPLLYIPQDDPAPELEDKPADVLPDDTSMYHAVQHGRGVTELDTTSELDSKKDSGATAPPAPDPVQEPTPESQKPNKPAYWGDLVAETLQAFNAPRGSGVKIAEQLAGVATKGARAEHNCTPPAQLGEVTAFVKWFRQEHGEIDLPTSAESLALWWHRFKTAARPTLSNGADLLYRMADGSLVTHAEMAAIATAWRAERETELAGAA